MVDYLGAIGAVGSWAGQPLVWVWKNLPTTGSTIIVKEIHASTKGHGFYRLGALSGTTAILMGMYCSQELRENSTSNELVSACDSANKYHMIGSLLLLAVPLSSRPRISGSLIASGMVLYSGSCYWHAMSGDSTIRNVTPYGKMLMLAGATALAL